MLIQAPTAIDRLGRRLADALDPDQLIDGVERETEETDEANRCAGDLFYWLDNYAWLVNPKAEDPAEREFRLELWPRQRNELLPWLLDGYDDSEELVLNKAREIGATWMALHVVWWLFRFERNFSALLISRKEDLVDDGGDPRGGSLATLDSLFGKLDFITSRQPRFLRPKVYRKHLLIRNLSNGSKIVGETTSEGVARSTRHSLVLVDEAAHIDARKQKSIRASLESVARSLWWISTPRGRSNEFGFMVTAYRGNAERYLELDWTTNPDRDLEWFDGLLVDKGGRLTWDLRAQEHACSLAGVSGERIWKAPTDAALYGDEDLPDKARGQFLVVAGMDFGTGPSWTACIWALVSWDLSPHEHLPLIWIDRERTWSRTPAHEIGADIIGTHRSAGYGQNCHYTGDPAGRAAESDQDDWEGRLNAAGVPLVCLPGECNTHEALHVNGIDDVQTLIDGGLLRLHRELVPVTVQTFESWEWNIPDGIDPRFVSRAAISPKKDSWSHVGQAVVYLVQWVLRFGRERAEEVGSLADKLPKGSATAIADLYSKL